MSLTWAVELSAGDADAAQSLRLVPGVEARLSDEGNSLWLRGPELDQATSYLVRRLPCRRRFTLVENGKAVPEGGSVPVMTMLGSGWVPLRHLGTLELPSVRKPSSSQALAPVRLVDATREKQSAPDLAVMPFRDWYVYAVTAPAVRLNQLRFAVSEDKRAAVHGQPLPPLLGTFYEVDTGIAVPCGRQLKPTLSPGLLARQFSLGKGDVLLFHEDGKCELLDGSGFAAATRSAVRATAQALDQAAEE